MVLTNGDKDVQKDLRHDFGNDCAMEFEQGDDKIENAALLQYQIFGQAVQIVGSRFHLVIAAVQKKAQGRSLPRKTHTKKKRLMHDMIYMLLVV